MKSIRQSAVEIRRKSCTDGAERYEGTLSRWAVRLILFPRDSKGLASWLHSLLSSGGIFVCALKGAWITLLSSRWSCSEIGVFAGALRADNVAGGFSILQIGRL